MTPIAETVLKNKISINSQPLDYVEWRGTLVQRATSGRTPYVAFNSAHSATTAFGPRCSVSFRSWLGSEVGRSEHVARKFVLVCLLCTGTKRAMDRERICNAMKTLTPREREVVNGVVSGLLNKEIASELGITERTVKAHRGSAMAKMGVKSAAELIKMILIIQLNGKEQKSNVQSNMSPENAGALNFIADLLQTTPKEFLEQLIFWHCRHEIDTRGVEYLAETIHAWVFPSRAAAQSAANKFEQLTVRYNFENK